MAQRYHSRPSELLDLDDAYASYCLDEAVLTFCAGVESKLNDVPTPKGKKGHDRRKANQDRLLKQLLQIEDTKKAAQFRDPADLFKKK